MRLMSVIQMLVLDVIQSVKSKWWSILKESVLGVGSYIPPLQSDGGNFCAKSYR